MKLTKLIASGFFVMSSYAVADVMEDVYPLQKQWAQANYELENDEQVEAFEHLIEQADTVVDNNKMSAESYIWRGIIKSTFAGVKGGLSALSYAEQAKVDFEKAMEIDDTALAGSAYASLGTLYFKVPGWPLGFGDDDKAKMMLEKAVAINPKGIDSHYFYAEYLAEASLYDEARQHYLKALEAKARPNRPLADEGRRADIQTALHRIEGKHSK